MPLTPPSEAQAASTRRTPLVLVRSPRARGHRRRSSRTRPRRPRLPCWHPIAGRPLRQARGIDHLSGLLLAGDGHPPVPLRRRHRRGRETRRAAVQGVRFGRLVGHRDGRRPEGKGDQRDGVLRLPRLGPELAVRPGLDEGDAGRVRRRRRRPRQPVQPEQAPHRPVRRGTQPRPEEHDAQRRLRYVTGLPNRAKDSGKFAPKGDRARARRHRRGDSARPGRSARRSSTRSTSAV